MAVVLGAWSAAAAAIEPDLLVGLAGTRVCVETQFDAAMCGTLTLIDADDFTVTLDNGSSVALHIDDVERIGPADQVEASLDHTVSAAPAPPPDPAVLQRRGRKLKWAGVGFGAAGLGAAAGGSVLLWQSLADRDGAPVPVGPVVLGGLLVPVGVSLGITGGQLVYVGALESQRGRELADGDAAAAGSRSAAGAGVRVGLAGSF